MMPTKSPVVLSGRAGIANSNSMMNSTLFIGLQPFLPASAPSGVVLRANSKHILRSDSGCCATRRMHCSVGFLVMAWPVWDQLLFAAYPLIDLLHTAFSNVLISQEIMCFWQKPGILLLLPTGKGGAYMHIDTWCLIIEPGYIKVGSMSCSFKDRALL